MISSLINIMRQKKKDNYLLITLIIYMCVYILLKCVLYYLKNNIHLQKINKVYTNININTRTKDM